MNKGLLKGLGITAGLLLAVSVVYGMRRRKQDRKSVSFFGELERRIDPASAGITESDAFDIYYWQKVPKQLGKPIIRLKESAAKDYAKQLYSAWGYLWDDERKVYSVLRALKDKVQVSQVAYWYWKKYEINLIDHIRSNMNSSEVTKVLDIVRPKENYRKA